MRVYATILWVLSAAAYFVLLVFHRSKKGYKATQKLLTVAILPLAIGLTIAAFSGSSSKEAITPPPTPTIESSQQPDADETKEGTVTVKGDLGNSTVTIHVNDEKALE